MNNEIGLGLSTEYSGDFHLFSALLKRNIPEKTHFFKTMSVGPIIWDKYLSAFPKQHRQEYNCNTCRRFIEEYGSLVYIDQIGKTKSVLWDTSVDYGYFNNIVNVMHSYVSNLAISSQFFTSENSLGTYKAGGWEHFNVPSYLSKVNSKLLSSGQLMAESKENFLMLQRARYKYSERTIATAISLLSSSRLSRPEKLIGHATWFREVRESSISHGDRILWQSLATAPKGYANVSSGMLGSLMDDLTDAVISMDQVVQRFNKKMDPLQYQRSQTLPGKGNVAEAERIIAKLGVARSFHRRYARLDELDLVWSPRGSSHRGLFSEVNTRDRPTTQRMTFNKFRRTLLSKNPERIWLHTRGQRGFAALCTAEYDDAPNIMQWSNPFSWYTYPRGSTPREWGVTPDAWVPLSGITLQPNMWKDECSHMGESVFFLIKNCKDSRHLGSALFPELLKNELKPIRKTIEEYSRTNKMQGIERASASGIKYQGGTNLLLRLTINGIVSEVIIDRLD